MTHSSESGGAQAKQPMSWREFSSYLIMIAVFVGVLSWRRIAYRFSIFYFQNFEPLYLALFLIACVALLFGVWRLRQECQALSERVKRLKPLWRSWTGIRVAALLDGSVSLYLSEKLRLGHVQIVGTTGRGKTESIIIPWIIRDLGRGWDAILIDGKGDPGLVEILQDAASSVTRATRIVAFDLGNLATSCTTNPLASGSAQQITDRLFAALDFEEPFYKGVQLNIAGSVIALIHEVDGQDKRLGTVTFRRLYDLLIQESSLTAALARSHNPNLRAKLTRFLAMPAKEREGLLMGLTSQLGPLAEGEVSVLLNGPVEGREYMSVSDILLRAADVSEPATLFVVLIPTLKYQQIGHRLGKLILQEVGWAVGERSSRMGKHAPFTPVYLDEFSAFVYSGFENILNKARSSQVALHLSHQSMADLSRVDANFAEIIHTNTNVKCLLGLNDPTTADFFARHMGTLNTEKTTERAKRIPFFGSKERTGDLSIREVEAFRVDPNYMKEAMDGRGVLHLPTPQGVVTERVQFERLSENELSQAKKRVLSMVKGLILTERDTALLRDGYESVALSIAQITSRHFPGTSTSTVCNRLTKLRKAGYLEKTRVGFVLY